MVKFVILFFFASISFSQKATTSRDFRYTNVVGQTDWFSCGPAAVATLLSYYYGVADGTEAKVLDLSLAAMGLKEADVVDRGVNMLALKKSLASFSVDAKGYKMTEQQLSSHLLSGGQPVILHTTKPQKHFVLAVAVVGKDILLADPSWGNRLIPLASLDKEKGFSGIVLVPIPPKNLADKATKLQSEMAKWAQTRANQLKRLKP